MSASCKRPQLLQSFKARGKYLSSFFRSAFLRKEFAKGELPNDNASKNVLLPQTLQLVSFFTSRLPIIQSNRICLILTLFSSFCSKCKKYGFFHKFHLMPKHRFNKNKVTGF